ncbi:MAG TPA: hypothetical protein VIP98_21070 [Microlunatus sp.]
MGSGTTARTSYVQPAKGLELNAATLLTIYIVVLFAVPSNLTFTPLGSLGRPSIWCGLLLLGWWVFARLQLSAPEEPIVRQPVRGALILLVVIALASFAAAMLGGQPSDQVSPAFTSLIRLASWSGVLLVAMDGLRTTDELVAVVRRLVVVVALMAVLGLAQFVTGDTLLGWLQSVPGLALDSSGIQARGDYTRAAATATHPLEYGVALIGVLPLALVAASTGGFNQRRPGTGLSATLRAPAIVWWLPVGVIALASMLAVSRSALIGLMVCVIASLPALSRPYRWLVVGGGFVAAIGVAVISPGLPQTMINMFLAIGDDPSALSRTNALDRIPQFMATSWFAVLIGRGFGTFLPRYQIFDDQWALTAVELGVLGLAALLGVAIAAIASAIRARRSAQSTELRAIASALCASMLAVCVDFLFFDGLSFPISAGLYFLIAGLAGAALKVSVLEAVETDRSAPQNRPSSRILQR